MEYAIDNEINYTTLQIRSMLAWNEMSKKQQKDTEPNQKLFFINSGYNIKELI